MSVLSEDPRIRDTHICCQVFDSGAVTIWFNDLHARLSRPGIKPRNHACKVTLYQLSYRGGKKLRFTNLYQGLYCSPQKHIGNKIVNLMASQNRCSVSYQMWLDRTPSALSKQLPFFTDNGCLHKIVFIFKCDVKPLAIKLFIIHDMYSKIRKYSPNIFKN